MKERFARTTLLGLLAVALALAALVWLLSSPAETGSRAARAAKSTNETKPRRPHPPVGAPRSTQGLALDERHDISADARPPNVRREAVIRAGLGEIQEMQQLNKAVFDDAAKRWNAQPRVKELIAQWKDVEEAWKTQDDEAKATVVPRMEAMWKEALGLLREEVEKAAREAPAGVR